MNPYKLELEVRDNEIDMQGIVSNTVYPIYFMHARHKFLKDLGVSFAEMTEKKQYLILTSTNIEFKKPLKSEDKLYVTCKVILEGKIKMGFEQEIRRLPDDMLMASSYNVGVCIDGNNRNKPYIPEIIQKNIIDKL